MFDYYHACEAGDGSFGCNAFKQFETRKWRCCKLILLLLSPPTRARGLTNDSLVISHISRSVLSLGKLAWLFSCFPLLADNSVIIHLNQLSQLYHFTVLVFVLRLHSSVIVFDHAGTWYSEDLQDNIYVQCNYATCCGAFSKKVSPESSCGEFIIIFL